MLKKIYRFVRLLPKRGKEPYVSLYRILNFYPYNITLYNQALVHKSSSIKMKNGRWINNERLEFLGDAILDAIVADIVFKEFEFKKEGFLTNMRSRIVQRDTLNKLSLELGIDKLVKTSTINKGNVNTHVYGNALEALIGAIYLDQGYRVTKRFVQEQLIGGHLDIDSVAEHDENYKSRLIEWGQKHKVDVEFILQDSSVDTNNVTSFTTAVVVGNIQVGTGVGISKKESHQKAAEASIDMISKDETFRKQLMSMAEGSTELP